MYGIKLISPLTLRLSPTNSQGEIHEPLPT